MGKKGGLFVGLSITPIKVENDGENEKCFIKNEIFVLFSNFKTKM